MKDMYGSFSELINKEKEGIDFLIDYKVNNPDIVIFTPHGGGIEPGTTKIVRNIAKNKFSYYKFNGIKKENNKILHITSQKFDEPKAKEIISKSQITISIHGCKGENDIIYIGGSDTNLAKKISKSLLWYKIPIKLAKKGRFNGLQKENICNKNIKNQGVQIEISKSLRYKMCNNIYINKNTLLKDFSNIITQCVENILNHNKL